MTIHSPYDPDTDTFSTFLRPDDVPVSYGDGYEGYVQIGAHGRFRFGKVRRHDRWWLAKSLMPGAAPADTALLRKEFDIGVSMDHPGIARVIDFADIPGVGPSIIMEWVSGCTLSLYLQGKPKPKAVRCIWRQIIEATAYMHRRGAVHGDLKPGNIMITEGGDVKLIDFGLGDAQWSALPATGGGSPGYSAPEQMKGEVPTLRSDVFALGSVLDILRRRMGLLRRLSMRRAARRAMRTEPARRPQDAASMGAATEKSAALTRYALLALLVLGALVAVVLLLPKAGGDAVPILSTTMTTNKETHINNQAPAPRDTFTMPSDPAMAPSALPKDTLPPVKEPDLNDLLKKFDRAVYGLWLHGWDDAKYKAAVATYRRDLKAFVRRHPGFPRVKQITDSLASDPCALHAGLPYMARHTYAYLDSAYLSPGALPERVSLSIVMEASYLSVVAGYKKQ